MLWFCAGLAMFLTAMLQMRQTMEECEGEKIQKIMKKYTSNRRRAVLCGLLVTAAMQSSSAVTVLAVSLVGCGLLDLEMSIYVLLGANVGTTVTAQLIRLLDVRGLLVLQMQNLTPLLWLLGALLLVFERKRCGEFLTAFSLMFTGLLVMRWGSSAIFAIKWLQEMLQMAFQNPLIGFAAGFGVALMVQSSSAAIAMLQTLCVQLADVRLQNVYAMLIGISLGGAFATMLFAQIGARNHAGWAAVGFFCINLAGSALAAIGVLLLQGTPILTLPMSAGAIADVHMLTRLATAVVIYPFVPIFYRFPSAKCKKMTV